MAGTTRKAWSILVVKPRPTAEAASTNHTVLGPLQGPHGGVGGQGEQENEKGVGVVVAEHQDRHRRRRHHGTGQERRARTEPPADRGVEQSHAGHAFERLGHEDAPRVQTEETGGELHHPQGGRRLVDGDEVRGSRTSRRRRPSSSSSPPGRRRSRRCWPIPNRPVPTGRPRRWTPGEGSATAAPRPGRRVVLGQAVSLRHGAAGAPHQSDRRQRRGRGADPRASSS